MFCRETSYALKKGARVSLTMLWLVAGASALGEDRLEVTKPDDFTTVLMRPFSAPREVVFAALTQADQLLRWMKPQHVTLLTCEVDFRVGGTFRYVFKRENGRQLEVRGAYEEIEPPRRFVYVETYDFSPLKIRVTTELDDGTGKTVFKQTLVYATKEERDEDFDGVATSSADAFTQLEEYLRSNADTASFSAPIAKLTSGARFRAGSLPPPLRCGRAPAVWRRAF